MTASPSAAVSAEFSQTMLPMKLPQSASEYLGSCGPGASDELQLVAGRQSPQCTNTRREKNAAKSAYSAAPGRLLSEY